MSRYVDIDDVLNMLADCGCAEGTPDCPGGDDCENCSSFSINYHELIEELDKLDKYTVDEIVEIKSWGR